MLAHFHMSGVIDSMAVVAVVWAGLWADAVNDVSQPGYGLATSILAIILLAMRIYQTDRERKQLDSMGKGMDRIEKDNLESKEKRHRLANNMQRYEYIISELKETIDLLETDHVKDQEIIADLKADRVQDRHLIARNMGEIDELKREIGGVREQVERVEANGGNSGEFKAYRDDRDEDTGRGGEVKPA